MKKGDHHTEKSKEKMRLSFKGRKLSEEHKKKISKALKGKPLTYKRIISEETKKKLSESLKGKKRPQISIRLKQMGHRPPSNKGVPMSEEQKKKLSKILKERYDRIGRKEHRTSYHLEDKKYKDWRISVFERDKYTCCFCHQIGGKLQAHHIKSWSKYPDLRFELDNGITVCIHCHKEVHEWKTKKN